ncbi:PRTRC system ThiF family protein [Noviherbaspirillum galbum]|uniref:PRTRC system ThiF family protein n=1 Tax=Noviherbaspirillum galbum TaxID=2709383 RepID=A0A6B3SNS4_9BURK|nr:PRTRC system ThiF family protein [Noviherbaspirillum galbum]NEX60112.1 PRTRC system ThiF family protein [Noviherbaspirillum galbum]
MKEHFIHSDLLRREVKIDVIGAGGTGSQVINGLARLHLALLSLGHPGGLDVTLWDDDVVSQSNVGRQAFFPVDVGSHKAPTLINRLNVAFGLGWESRVERVASRTSLRSDIVIGCVDNRRARRAILDAASDGFHAKYWLDCGNRMSDGQVILGEVPSRMDRDDTPRLPHAGDLFPELVDPSLDAADDAPSCSLAEALEKQSLFINTAMAMQACQLLFELFRHGRITHHGLFMNLKTGRTSPLPVSPETWKRFGFIMPTPKPAKQAKGMVDRLAA